MDVKDYYYDLPQELIAQDPLQKRSDSRLMVLHKDTGEIEHRIFSDIKEYLKPGDCLVINDTKVIPARLLGTKVNAVKTADAVSDSDSADIYAGNKTEQAGAAVEFLLLKNRGADVWEALVKPGKRLKPGARVTFGDGLLNAEILDYSEDGARLVRFEYDGIWEEILDRLGEMPLPPYITHRLEDKDRYQTVYAEHSGSAAAPTAGLHFTKELLAEIEASGVRIARVTLHVGLGTFRPVKVDRIEDHHMHSEYFELSQETADIINEVRAAGGRIISVGTTSTRTLESVAARVMDEQGRISACSGNTDIFIYPGYRFKLVDALITNFHLPESTLIMLVSAFYDREKVLEAYRIAVEEKYRFFSFGDAMLLISDNSDRV